MKKQKEYKNWKEYADENKPYKETESFNMWKFDKGKSPKIADDVKDDKNNIEIDLGNGKKFALCGFNKAVENGKLMFAFKVKEKMLLYYVPNENKENEKVKLAIDWMEKSSNKIGYSFINIDESIKSAMIESELEDKDNGK